MCSWIGRENSFYATVKVIYIHLFPYYSGTKKNRNIVSYRMGDRRCFIRLERNNRDQEIKR